MAEWRWNNERKKGRVVTERENIKARGWEEVLCVSQVSIINELSDGNEGALAEGGEPLPDHTYATRSHKRTTVATNDQICFADRSRFSFSPFHSTFLFSLSPISRAF